jgi:hypothetical protein
MCGIAGFVGKSKRPEVTYDIITQVFSGTEARGTDAAGFWGTDVYDNILYHKEPIRSSELVKSPVWRAVANYELDLLLVHARQASAGVGEPYMNKNNHPFVSTDRTLGLIHNGRIPEFDTLRRRFQVLSECDSEILLRIIEAGEDEGRAGFPSSRFVGIKNLFSLINHGHMAVALGEWMEGGARQLWLFRNRHRSLWVIDLRQTLGQVFFCSTPDIWHEAVSSCRAMSRQKLIEVPAEEVWHFEISREKTCPDKVDRYQVCREAKHSDWNCNGPLRKITERPPPCKVVTELNDQEELVVNYPDPKGSGLGIPTLSN